MFPTSSGLIYVARKDPFECLKGGTSVCFGQFDIQHIKPPVNPPA